MPVVPNLFERLVFRLNLAPGLMLDYLGAQAFRVLVTAHKLGVFEAVAGGPLTAAEVAHRIKGDERGTALLLDALVALGYLQEENGRYAATAMAVKWFPILGGGVRCFEMLVERLTTWKPPSASAARWSIRASGWTESRTAGASSRRGWWPWPA